MLYYLHILIYNINNYIVIFIILYVLLKYNEK